MSGVLWTVLMFIGIVVGGTVLALERVFDLGRTPLLDAIVIAAIVLVLVSFLAFMSRLRE